MGIFKSISRAVSKAGKQVSGNIVGAGALPFELVGGIAAKSIQGVAPALGAATGVLQANPALAGLAGSAFGIPGLGGMFGGAGDIPQAPAGGQFTGPAPVGVPTWVWIAGGIAAVLGLVLIIRKRT